MKKRILFIGLLILSLSSLFAYFNPVQIEPGQTTMNLYITAAIANDTNLNIGDEIGVFDGSTCVGAYTFSGEIDAQHPALIPSRGFVANNQISFKFYLMNSEELISSNIDPTYVESSNTNSTGLFVIESNAIVSLNYASQPNLVPIANAGDDQTVLENMLITLDGSGSSDPENQDLIFQWTAPEGIILDDNTAMQPTFTTPEVANNQNPTTLEFSLVVFDGQVVSEQDNVLITVIHENFVPQVSFTQPEQTTFTEGEEIQLELNIFDTDAMDEISISWMVPQEIVLSDNSIFNPTFTAPQVDTSEDFTISVSVNDGFATSETANLTITIKDENLIPVASFEPIQVRELGSGILNGEGTDPENSELSYAWTAEQGITFDDQTLQNPTITVPAVDVQTEMNVTLIVNDGIHNSEPFTNTITIVPNTAPIADAGTNQISNEGNIVYLNGGESSDANNDELMFLWTVEQLGLDAGINIQNADQQIASFIAPGGTETNTPYEFTLTVSDGIDQNQDQITVVVINATPNNIPIPNAGEDQEIRTTESFSVTGSASYDPDGDDIIYEWSIVSNPDDLDISIQDPSLETLNFEGIEISNLEINSHSITFGLKVTDQESFTGEEDMDEVVVTIKNQRSPEANAGSFQSVEENQEVTLDGSSSIDHDGDELTYTWTQMEGDFQGYEVELDLTNPVHPTFTAPEIVSDEENVIALDFILVVNDGNSNSEESYVTVEVKNQRPPVAMAGQDNTFNEGETVTLDGTASYDPDIINGQLEGREVQPLTYQWTAPEGINLSSNTSATPTFVVENVVAETTFTFSLVVNDGTYNSEPDEVTITIANINEIPIAILPQDMNIDENSLVTLDGSLSTDSDENELEYFWSTEPSLNLNLEDPQHPTFTAPNILGNGEMETIVVSLFVNDGIANSEIVYQTLTIVNVNEAPSVNLGNDFTANERDQINISANISDLDNDELTLTWSYPENVIISDATISNPDFILPSVDVDTNIEISLSVNDQQGRSITNDTVNITITNTTKFDIVYRDMYQPMNIIISEALLNLDGLDIGDEIGVFDGNLCVGHHIINEVQEYPIIIQASMATESNNGFTEGDQYSFKVYSYSNELVYEPNLRAPLKVVLVQGNDTFLSNETVIVKLFAGEAPANTIPVAVAEHLAEGNIYEGDLVELDGENSYDTDEDQLYYIWEAPAGIVLQNADTINPRFIAPNVITNLDYGHNFEFTLTVFDGVDVSQPSTVVVPVMNINQNPTSEDKTFVIDEDNTLTITEEIGLLHNANDVDQDDLTASLSEITSGAELGSLTINPNGSFEFIPVENANGTFEFNYLVNDGLEGNSISSVMITINAINDAPEVTINPVVTGDIFVGSQLMISSGTWNDNADSVENEVTLSYIWERADDINFETNIIEVANTASYELTQNDKTKYLRAKVTATDNGTPESASTTFTSEIIYIQNNQPVLVYNNEEIETLEITLNEDSSKEILLNSSDLDNFESFTWNVIDHPNNGVFSNGQTVERGSNGYQLYNYIPNSDYFGSDSATIRLSDGTDQVDLIIDFIINPINDAPTFNEVTTVELNEDFPMYSMGITGINSGAENENDDISFEITSNNDALFSNYEIIYQGGTTAVLNIYSLENAFGNADFEITLNDNGVNQNLIAQQTFAVIVTSINDVPEIDVDNYYSTPIGQTMTIDLLYSANDVESSNEDLVWEIEITNPNLDDDEISWEGNLVPNQNNVFELTPIDNSFFGSVEATFTVSDGEDLINQTGVILEWTDNHAPEIHLAQTSFVLNENDEFALTLTDENKSDIEDPLSSLVWSIEGVNEDLVYSFVNGTLTITPPEYWNGEDEIELILTDPHQSFSTVSLNLVWNAINYPPELSVVGNQVIDEDNSITIPLEYIEYDLEDEVTIEINSSDENVTVTQNEASYILTPSENWYGSSEITVKVTDNSSENAFDREIYTFTVNNVNDAPILTPFTAQAIDEDTSINLAFEFTDADTLAYPDQHIVEITSSDSNVNVRQFINGLHTSGTGFVLEPEPNWFGSSQITVKVTDTGSLYDEEVFTLTVNNVNDSPQVVQLPSYTVQEDFTQTISLDLNDYFSDIDNDILTYTLNYVENEVNIAQTNSQIVISSVENWNGIANISVQASDNQNSRLIASGIITISVAAVNDAPEIINPISDQNLNEDFEQVVIDLTDRYIDVDSENISLTLINNSNLLNSEIVGNELILVSNSNLFGSTNLQILISDSQTRTIISDNFTVNITSVNDDPQVSEIPEINTQEDFIIPQIVNLNNYFSDEDNESLNYMIEYNEEHVSVQLTGSVLIIESVENWNGVSNIIITASDAANSTAVATLTVNVMAQNDAPYLVTPIADVQADEDFSTISINLDNHFADNDEDDLTFEISFNENEVTIVNSGSLLEISSVDNWNGNSNVFVTAFDGYEEMRNQRDQVTDSFLINVSAVNDSPIIVSEIPDFDKEEDFAPFSIELNEYFTDPDFDELTYSITYDDTEIQVEQTNEMLIISSLENWNGLASISVVAEDSQSRSRNMVTDTFIIEVSPANDSPYLVQNLPESIDALEDFTGTQLNLADYFADPDGDALTYNVEFNEDHIQAEITGSMLIINSVENWYGTSAASIIVSDGNISDDLIVALSINIESVNDEPILDSISPQEINFEVDIDSLMTFNVQVSDIDNNISYEWKINNETQAAVSNSLTWRFMEEGDIEIKVTATDGEFEIVQAWNIHVNAVSIQNGVPQITSLKQNYPNPFGVNSNSRTANTTIAFDLANNSKIQISIYNIKGQRVKSLVNEDYKAGSHQIQWNGKDDNNQAISSGIYFYRFVSERKVQTKKLTLIQ